MCQPEKSSLPAAGRPVVFPVQQGENKHLSFISILLTSNTHPLQQAANFKALKKHFSLFILAPTCTLGSGGSQLPAPRFTWDMKKEGKASLIPGM